MRQYVLIFQILIIATCTFGQNVLNNSGFDQGNFENINNLNKHDAFDERINSWEGRLWNGPEVAWHSPDWLYYEQEKYIQIRTYELVQQKIGDNLTPNKICRLTFRVAKSYSTICNAKLQFFVGKSKLKYCKEKLILFQNEENHLCSVAYKTIKGNNGEDYFKVAEIARLDDYLISYDEWYDIIIEFKNPNIDELDWFGFQIVELDPVDFPCLPIDNCSSHIISIDDVELVELEKCNMDPCSPTDGVIRISNYNHQDYVYCLTGLDNVSKISNFVIRDQLGSEIYHMSDIECGNGINDDICWSGITDSGSPVASAMYNLSFNAHNDCGVKEINKVIIVPQLVNNVRKQLPICNEQISVPRKCCEEASEYLISNVTLSDPAGINVVIPGNLILQNLIITEQSGLINLQAGNEIELSNCLINGDFFANIEECESSSRNDVIINKNSTIFNKESMVKPYETFDTTCDSKELSMHDYDPEIISIYPNPASNKLNISISNFSYEVPYEILKTESACILFQDFIVQNKQQVDISNLPPGSYIIRFYFGETTFTKKIIKE